MPKIKYDESDIRLFNMSAEGKKYLEYNDKVGGEPIGLIAPFGYPEGVEEHGGVISVYDACIKEGITWEEFLNFNPPDDVIM